MNKLMCVMGLLSPVLSWASGSKPVSPPPPAPNTAEIRISSEVAPAGGTVQVKYSLTNPQPILSGGVRVPASQVDGVSLWSPSGDAAGAAVLQNGSLYIAAVSPLSSLGTVTDYPFLTVTMDIASTLAAGTIIPLNMTSTSLLSSSGAIAVTTKPGTLTVGGNFFIHNVSPGGGTYPAGTTIRVEGKGFLPTAQLKTPQMKIASWKVVSSTEIDFTLKEQTTMDAQPIQVINGSFSQTYYSYLRGSMISQPSHALLRNTEPIFQQQTHSLASTQWQDVPTAAQYPALALQNPNAGPTVVTLTLTHMDGSVETNALTMLPGARIMDDVATLVRSTGVKAGDRLDLVSLAPIQILGLKADENAWTVQPYLPSF